MYNHIQEGYLIREEFLKHGMKAIHIYILNWFVNFIKSGNMKSYLNTDDGFIYYWVNYNKIKEDIPELNGKSRWTIKKYLNDLIGKDKEGDFPLKKKVINRQNGKYVCFALDPIGFPLFCSKKGDSMINYDSHINYNRTNTFKKSKQEQMGKDFTPKGREIIESILNQEGNDFRHIINEEGTATSKLLLQVEEYLMELYSGIFMQKHKFDKEWLEKRNDDEITEYLNKMKGNWDCIKKFIPQVVKYYCENRRSSSENFQKGLTLNLSDWFYNYRTKKSLFLTSMEKSFITVDDFTYESIKKIFDEKTLSSISHYYDPVMDKRKFAYRLKEVYSYLYTNYQDIVYLNKEESEYKMKTPFIMEKFLKFAIEDREIKNPNAFGLEGYAWTKFVDFYRNYYDIDLCPGETVLKEMREKRIEEHERMKNRVLCGTV